MELKSELLESCPRGEEEATQQLKVLCLNAKNLQVGQETYPLVTFSLAFSRYYLFKIRCLNFLFCFSSVLGWGMGKVGWLLKRGKKRPLSNFLGTMLLLGTHFLTKAVILSSTLKSTFCAFDYGNPPPRSIVGCCSIASL